MILWRVLPWRADVAPTQPGGPLWFPRELQGAGRHDNPDRYGCLYMSESPVSTVAETLAPFRGAGAAPTPAILVRAGLPLALARLDLHEDRNVVDLDDPRVLTRHGLRPSHLATRTRAATQAYAARLFEELPHAAGLRWWSAIESSLVNVTLFDRAASALTLADIQELTVSHPSVGAAAELLGLG